MLARPHEADNAKEGTMEMSLEGKVALVTGGSRGIGRAVSRRLAEAGCSIAINYIRHAAAANEVAGQIRALGFRALTIKANVAEPDELESMFGVLRAEFGHLDILISNAASGVLRPAMELSRRHWQWTMEINAGALIPLAQQAVPLMGHGGSIVAVSSLGAVRAIPNYIAVGASKAALESVVRHLALELGPKGIRVNAVSAGVVDTEALKHFPNRKKLLVGSAQKTPAGRLTTPEDVADAVLFLVSPLAKMVQGHTLVVDGGYSITG
jgi:enoyl-[acyl-carrier protein] reductase III